MGRKPKIIPHIPGTFEQIANAFLGKDRVYVQAKAKRPIARGVKIRKKLNKDFRKKLKRPFPNR